MTTNTKEWLQQTIAEFENTRDDIPFGLSDDDAKILIVLKRALVSLERERIRREHAEWSDATFGNFGPVGPLKHLSKEALEAAADPSDPLEWADMQFLLWDAQRRMGISDEFITRAMIEKLEINKSRQWTEPKDGEPRLHIKEQPATVVPDEMATSDDMNLYQKSFAQGYNACRAAMLQGGQPVSQTYNLPELIEGMEVSVGVSTCDFDAGHRYFGTVTEISELYTAKNGYILLVQDAKPNFDVNGNSPVIPDGWISCSERMPDREYVLAGDFSGTHYLASIPNVQVGIYADWFDDEKPCWDDGDGNDLHLKEVTHWMPLPEPPQEVK
ncbi:DUF550 domain-containing protein [Salmonella enterica subsp. enterica]|uniref:dATP/dGTP pyrophosphohydrolase domain-containing protein n=1 Tax=Salmonella TaxID=590 RepID=UPI0022B68AA1|nr:dATP/dGTP pyrophosphohydrolase domain-containing protein [Salmonella enterica]MCZ7108471.1 DUF550 domain-containing protein [Salmonella enterica]MDJ7514029.1 DUF550 domain-containing protein [Salmonella enterica]